MESSRDGVSRDHETAQPFRTTTAGIGGRGRPDRDPRHRSRLSDRWYRGSVRLNHEKPRGRTEAEVFRDDETLCVSNHLTPRRFTRTSARIRPTSRPRLVERQKCPRSPKSPRGPDQLTPMPPRQQSETSISDYTRVVLEASPTKPLSRGTRSRRDTVTPNRQQTQRST